MKKKLISVYCLLFCLCFILTACGGNSKKVYDINTLAVKDNASVGKYEFGYVVPGGGGAFNVISVKKYSDYTFNETQTYKNVVVVEVATSIELTKQLVKESAFALLNEYGKESVNINIDVGAQDRFNFIIINGGDLDDVNVFNEAKFFEIKGLDENKNEGKRNLVFKIAQ